MKIGILNRIGAWNLKIFFSISLGIHLLFLSITYILFPDFKMNRLSTFNIEVSILPLMAEEKQVKTQIKKEEKRLLQKEKKEESTHKKKLEPESPTLVQNASTDIPNQESKPFLQHEEEEKAVNEPIMRPKVGALPLDEGLTFEEEENFIPGHGAASKGEDPSINFPSSSPFGEWHRDPLPNTESSERPQSAMKNPSLSDGEILFVKPRYAESPKPLYPQEARKKGYEGEVVLRVEVLSNGRVGQVEVKKSSGYELLDRSALTTVKQWRFIPAKKGENAIPLWVNIPIKFQLQ